MESDHKAKGARIPPEPKLSQEEKFNRYWNIILQKMEARKQPKEVIEQTYQVLKKSQNDPTIDRALGAIYGAMIGDSIGAYCEFNSSLMDETVNEAMEMNGGGTFGLNAGQFTDDSEMASHLLVGLSKYQENKPLSEQQKSLVCHIGIEYIKWEEGGPFDIGNTTRTSIAALYDNEQLLKDNRFQFKEPKQLQSMFDTIYGRNKNSQANGSLMRISPMAFFLAILGQSPSKHTQLIKDEVRLTHPNERLQAAGVFWVSTLFDLIRRPNNKPKTFQDIIDTRIIDSQFKTIETWIDEAQRSKESAMPGSPNMGYAKIAFSYGLRVLDYLAKGKEKRTDAEMYSEWMWWIIKRAGDTDTNGAIAGSLMGSIVGFWNLPFRYVSRSLMTITDSNSQKIAFKGVDKSPPPPMKNKYQTPSRPECYEPWSVLLNALGLVGRLYKRQVGKQ